MEIRIRHEYEPADRARTLGDVPFDQLNLIIPTLQRWGVVYDGDEVPDLVAQIEVNDESAFFAVIIADREE